MYVVDKSIIVYLLDFHGVVCFNKNAFFSISSKLCLNKIFDCYLTVYF